MGAETNIPKFLADRGYRVNEWGAWVTTDDVEVGESIENALGNVLGFCGCGDPDSVLVVYRDALALVGLDPNAYPSWQAYWDDYCAKRKELFGDHAGFMYLTFYQFHRLKLVEHGTSLPGWLTQAGRDLLDCLTALSLAPLNTPA